MSWACSARVAWVGGVVAWTIIITALMKHYRNTAPLREKEEKGGKVGEGKTLSPATRTPQARLHEYENITKKAK